MKKFLLALALFLLPTIAVAQCNGVFPNNTACGNLTGSSNTPRPIPLTSFPSASPGGTSGQIQYNNSGAFGGFTMAGDCTVSIPNITCIKTNGVAFGPAATDTPVVTTTHGGTGANNATNTTNDILASNGTNGNFIHTTITTVLNAVCSLSPTTCAAVFGYYYAGWYGTTCDGVTDTYTSLQAFLNAVSAAGAAGTTRPVGYFPPGNCYFSAGQLTITTNTAVQPINYKFIGYGTTLTPDPTKVLDGLDVARGTFTTLGDEQRSVTVEGLNINAHNNANASIGINVADGHVYLIGNSCYAGDDGSGPHNQGNFACYWYHQINSTDPNTGPFYGKMEHNDCKGHGVSTSAVPVCYRFDGSVNAMAFYGNHCAEATYCMRVFSPCTATNNNCAYMANGLAITNNNFENATECIEFHTFVPSISFLVGGLISGNTFEACSSVALDIATFTQQSPTSPNAQLAYGPNTFIAPIGTVLSNPNSITIKNF